MPESTRPRATRRPPTEPAPPDAWPAAVWRVRLLGGVALDDGRQQITRLPSRAAAALLARLALWPARAHAREEMIELLWPGVALDVGRNRLRQTLSVLRSVLEPAGAAAPVILADRLHLRVAPQALACDVALFEAACRGGAPAAARHWYRGELMPGYYDEWIDDERLRLAALADALDDDDLLPAPPAPPARASAPPPAAPAIDPAWPLLPHYLTPVFGIDLAGSRLREAIAAHRLVTVAGPGGSGKTRLAVEVARTLARPDPAWSRWQGWVAFVPMVQCQTGAQMLDRLLMTLRLDAGAADPMARVTQALAGRSALLVLDNLEQVVEPAAEIVTELLAALPLLHVVATSRRVLGVAGEHLLAVEPLALPRAQAPADELALNPAVALFVDRARERRTDFHLGAQNAAAVAELVALLEGHPLAIELAAARVRSTPPAQWVSLLHEARAQRAAGQPGETLALLARSGPRGQGDGRHASMLHVIDWSWRLLEETPRRLLAALTVFDGGCDAEAARAVFDPQMPRARMQLALDELVSSSLIVAQGGTQRDAGPADAAAGPRFTLYDTVREFAAAQADDAQRHLWRARHRGWLACFARDDGATPDAWAQIWAHRAGFVDVTLPPSGLQRLEDALRACTAPPLRLLGHGFLAGQLFEAGRHQRAREHADAVLALLGEPAAIAQDAWQGAPFEDAHPVPLGAWAVGWALRVHMRVGQPLAEDDPWLVAALASTSQAQARLGAEAASAPSRAAGVAALRARLIGLQASLIMRNRADHAGAEPLRREALALAAASGNRLAANEARVALAICLGFQHRTGEQLEVLVEVEREARALGQPRLLCFALSVRGYGLADLRRHVEAVHSFHDCLGHAARALAWRELFYGLWNLPRSLAHLRQPERAATLMGFAEAFYAEHFGQLGPEDLREARRTRRLVAVQIGRAGLDAAWAAGPGLGVDAALALAFGEIASEGS